MLAVQMPDGSPHAATVHFAYTEEPLTFVYMTSPTSRKYESFAKGPTRASVVVGTSEGVVQTLQMDGQVSLSDNEEIQKMYLEKFPEAAHLFKKDVVFTFTPTWWRYTDWSNPGEKVVLVSQ